MGNFPALPVQELGNKTNEIILSADRLRIAAIYKMDKNSSLPKSL